MSKLIVNMQKIKLNTRCPMQLIQQINFYTAKGYQTTSKPVVFLDCQTNKLYYHQTLY